MPRCAPHALSVALALVALAGCKQHAPAELRHLPRDASVVWSVDVGALVQSTALASPGPLASIGADKWREGIEECGVQPEKMRIVGSGSSIADAVVVITAPKVGDASVLRCLGRGQWRGEHVEPIFTLADDDETRLVQGDVDAGRVLGTDAVLFVGADEREQIDALAEGSDDPFADELAALLPSVEYDATAWVAIASPDLLATVSSEMTSLVGSVQFDDGLSVHAAVHTSDGSSADSVATTIDTSLRDVARWIYASPSAVDRMEITKKSERLALRMSITGAEWRGVDLRWIDERRGLVAAAKPEPERLAIAEYVAVEKVEVAAVVPEAEAPITGIATCDEYIRKYSACIDDHVPESARPQMKEAMAMTVEAWKQAAASPAAASALEPECQAALDAVASATKSMGCVW